jgi:hypothetical protein
MPTDSPSIDNVSDLIRLALTPVFLIAGVSSMLGVLASRLARVADQGFSLEAQMTDDRVHASHQTSVRVRSIAARAWFLLVAMALCVVCALLVTVVIALLYFGRHGSADLSAYVGPLFIVSIAALALAMLCLLVEVGIASTAARNLAGDLKRRAEPAPQVVSSDNEE